MLLQPVVLDHSQAQRSISHASPAHISVFTMCVCGNVVEWTMTLA